MKSGEEEKRRNVNELWLHTYVILSRPGIQLVRLQKQQIQFVINNSCDKGALQSMLQTPRICCPKDWKTSARQVSFLDCIYKISINVVLRVDKFCQL